MAKVRNHLIKTWMTDQPNHRIHRMVKCSRMFPPRMALFNLHVACYGGRLSPSGHGPSLTARRRPLFSPPRWVSTMEGKPQRPKGRDRTVSSLNIAIEAMNLAKEISSVTPAKAVFGSVSILLTMVKVRFLVSYDWNSHA